MEAEIEDNSQKVEYTYKRTQGRKSRKVHSAHLPSEGIPERGNKQQQQKEQEQVPNKYMQGSFPQLKGRIHPSIPQQNKLKSPTPRHAYGIENTNHRGISNFQNQATYKDSGIITANNFHGTLEARRQWNDASKILM